MSWSVTVQSKAAEALASFKEQMAGQGPCVEPEERVRIDAGRLVEIALEAQDPEIVVMVNASGHQSIYEKDGVQRFTNTLHISIVPGSLE